MESQRDVKVVADLFLQRGEASPPIVLSHGKEMAFCLVQDVPLIVINGLITHQKMTLYIGFKWWL